MRVASLARPTEWSLRIKPVYIKTAQNRRPARTVEVLHVAFRAFDRDASGEIDRQELALSMARLGMSDADAHVRRCAGSTRMHDTVSFPESGQAMAPILAGQHESDPPNV